MARGALGNDLYTGRRSFPFIQKRKVWFAIALALVALSILTLATRGLNRGIEFTGGSQFTVSGTKDTSQAAAAKILREKAGDDAARVVRVGGSTIRAQTTASDLGSAKTQSIREDFARAYGVPVNQVAATYVGPLWGQDISSKALQGFVVFLVAVAIGLTLYFRSWRNAAGAIIALFNDLVITVGVYAVFGFEVTPSTVTGLLTILGYSLYDTVVVFDKVRENSQRLLSQTAYTFADSVNLAVNQTLIRSLNTSITSILPVASILFIGTTLLGAGTLRDLSLVHVRRLADRRSARRIRSQGPRAHQASRGGAQGAPGPSGRPDSGRRRPGRGRFGRSGRHRRSHPGTGPSPGLPGSAEAQEQE